MAQITSFTFNPFGENSYIIYDDTKECIIIDPGCYTLPEKEKLANFIESEGLKPVRLINTHCHVDHVFGNKFVAEKYDLELECHKGEVPVLEAVADYAAAMGLAPETSPPITVFLEDNDLVEFGNTKLEVLFTPGHSPASISFYHREDGFVIAGDVLFQGSIGRTDLPGGDLNTLMQSIHQKLFALDEDTDVYPGHGAAINIGIEKATNPFILAYAREK